MKLMSYAKRRQASHIVREFLRGAGEGGNKRAVRPLKAFKYFAIASVISGLLVPGIIPALVVANLAYGVGALAYAGVNKTAVIAHRIANKGIPEAPNHNRRAQYWGYKSVRAVAATVAFAACAGTAGYAVGAMISDSQQRYQQLEQDMLRRPLPRQYNV